MGTEKIAEKVEIRPMQAQDLGFIIDIDQKLTGIQRTSDQTEIILADLGDPNSMSLVAELDQKGVGFAIARKVNIGEPVTETCAIEIIGVDPAYGRRGVATRLLDSLIQRCNSKNISSVRVVVSNRDSKMEGFFKHSGFKQAPLKVYSKVLS